MITGNLSSRSGAPDRRLIWEVVLAALLSAATLWAGLTVYYSAPQRYARLADKTYPGSSLRVEAGDARAEGMDLLVSGAGADHKLVLLLPVTDLLTDAFAAVRIRVSGTPPESLRWYFAWQRSFDDPTTTHEARLNAVGADLWELNLTRIPAWHDRVASNAVLLEGLRDRTVRIADVTLVAKPPTPGRIVRWVLDGWVKPEGWAGYSINAVIGGGAAELPLLPSVALWLAVACGLLLGMGALRRRRPDVGGIVALALGGWLLVDLRWQLDLVRQLSSTREQFAGRYQLERRDAADDREIFRLAQLVRDYVPSEPARIFLISRDPSGAGAYVRLRFHYYLLPHNVMSEDATLPDARYLRGGDYVLLLGAVTTVSFDGVAGELRWGGDRKSATLVLEQKPELRLFRIR